MLSILRHVLGTIQAILLLGQSTQPWGLGTLATTSTRAMLSTDLRVVETAHHHMIIVSKFAWCVDPLLNVDVLTGEFLDLAFDCILHEMLWLISVRHLLTSSHTYKTIGWANWLIHVLILKGHILLFLKSILSHCCNMVVSWKSRGRLHSNTTTRLSNTSMTCEWSHILHIIVIWGTICVILYPWSPSAIRQAIMHNLSSLSLILNASNLIMLLCL